MAIAHLGMVSGVYRSFKDCPFWGGPVGQMTKRTEGSEGKTDDEGAKARAKEAARGQAVASGVAAKAKSAAASGSTEAFKG
eukprot:6573491-Lingulodinium_polyedra.AAC.1